MLKPTIVHLKFQLLASSLQLPRWQAVGLLESIWLFAQYHAVDGDFTDFQPREIAAWVGWEGDPSAMLDTLVDTGWLDLTEDNRLVIHDWISHCPSWVKGSLKTTLGNQNPNSPKRSAKSNAKRSAKPDAVRLGRVGLGKEEEEILSRKFAELWQAYPARQTPGGKAVKGNREKALAEFRKVAAGDRSLLAQAIEAYRQSGQKPRDMFRWLKDGDWRQWIDTDDTAPTITFEGDLLDISEDDDASPRKAR